MLNGGLRAADGEGTAAPASWFEDQVARDVQASAVVTTLSDACSAEYDTRTSPPRARVTALATGKRRADWHRSYQLQLVVIDLIAVLGAIALGGLIRFGLPVDAPNARGDFIFAALLPAAWLLTVAANRGYEARFIGAGPIEFQRVFRSFLHVTVLTAFVAFATKTELARGFVIAVLPIALVFDLSLRYAARKHLHRRRAAGSALTSVLAVGGPESLARFTEMLRRDRYAGLHVVGACLSVGEQGDLAAMTRLAGLGVPVLGDADNILDSARRCGADTVAVLSGQISPEKLRWISWQLEETEVDLVVSPGLTEVAGRRLHIQPVAELPLLYVDEPKFTGLRRVAKSAFDRGVAAAALFLLSPVLLAVALAVRIDSRGPALFRQQRVGRRGATFNVLKFRSMCVDAEERLVELQDLNESDGMLFKIRSDPRVTRVGRLIRRYSLDELPQLINVVRGEMSLVGPRPPLPSEVENYGDDVRRRLLVKPGITGLWQVSGRSDLSWEESVRLDLRYVENWSFTLDMVVLFKTARAVVRATGAY